MYMQKNNENIDELVNEKKEVQIEEMRKWFFENYQDPVDSCPFESSNGGFYFIWGGPFEPKDVLYTEFGGVIEEEVIDELSSELEQITSEWSGIPAEYPDEDEYKTIIPSELFSNLESTKDKLLNILETNKENKYLHNMLFAWSITALETYLSETFKVRILTSREYIKKFIEQNIDFNKETIKLKDIFLKHDGIEKYCIEYLNDIIWHNLRKVAILFDITFSIKFPKKLQIIYSSISKRHDIVHRSGKTKDGKTISVEESDILELINAVYNLAQYIETEFKKNA